MKKQKLWVHQSTFILATAGAAVGLGNIWKFPYMAGDGGGGAFVLVYLLCLTLVGLPLMVAESIVGRYAQFNPVDAILLSSQKSGASKGWQWMAIVGILVTLLIFSFYSVVGGWSFAYALKLFTGTFNGLPVSQIGGAFGDFLADYRSLIIWHTLFAVATGLIVIMGVVNGIEKSVRYLMPMLVVLIVFMLGYSAFFSGSFSQGISFLFYPDFSKINQNTILSALAQAFFTLNVGLCIVMAYAAYTPKSVSIIRSSVIIVIVDTIVALLMGMVIFPIVFAQGLNATAGPGLLFVTLTTAFAHIPAGHIIGGIFFLLVSIAALTSSISMVEPAVSIFEQKFNISRKIITPVIVGLCYLAGLMTVFSFNLWAQFKYLDKTVFEWIDLVTSSIGMPLNGLALLIFVGWVVNDNIRRQELQLQPGQSGLYHTWLILLKYVSPVLVLMTFIYGIYQKFFS